MNLAQAKKKVYALLDEYSVGGEVELDKDIEIRLGCLFDMCQKNLASLAPIRRMIDVTEGEFTPGGKIVKVLAVYNVAGERIYPKMIGDTFIIEDNARLDVLTLPKDITDETPDTYEFEIKEALAECMPYWVAASLSVVDMVTSPSNLMSQFNTMVASAIKASSPYAGTVNVI